MVKRKKKSILGLDLKRLLSIDYTTLSKKLLEKGSIAAVLEISDRSVTKLYLLGLAILEREEYDAAADAFYYLSIISPFISSHWLRLGNAEQGRGNITSALHSYSVAMDLDIDDPFPFIYAAQCHRDLKNIKMAKKCLKMAVIITEDGYYPQAKPLIEEFLQDLDMKKL